MIDWDLLAGQLRSDGGLRDVYVCGVSPADWDRVLSHVKSEATELEYSIDGLAMPEVPSAQAALAVRDSASPCLRAVVGGITFNCHFFTSKEIEFDFDPTEIQGPEHLRRLLEFVRTLGTLTGKLVLVSPENAPTLAFLRYDPSQSTLEYIHA